MQTTTNAPLRQIEDLPGPRGIPFFGNALQVSVSRIHLDMEQWARQYGPLFKLRLVNRRVLVVADHELFGAVMKDRPHGFRRSPMLGIISTGGQRGGHLPRKPNAPPCRLAAARACALGAIWRCWR